MTAGALSISIESSFSAAATTYDAAALVQIEAARRLRESMEVVVSNLPDGPVLEIGCGTGIMTSHILSLLPNRQIKITDLSLAMIETCRVNISARFGLLSNMTFEQLDAHKIDSKSKYASVVCSFSLQWFQDFAGILARLSESLLPGGMFFFAVPSSGSFPEWREVCRQAGAIFTGNGLPDAKDLQSLARETGLTYSFRTESISSSHRSALAFFQSLRAVGASLQLNRTPDPSNLLKVMRAWDNFAAPEVISTYQVCYGWMRK